MTHITVVVNVRERYMYTEESLQSLYETADMDFDLVYVDINSPAPTRRFLERAAAARNFTLVRVEHNVSPNVARNIGVRHAAGDYVIFVDNDVIFEPGWMSALVRCAEETGAWLVGPLYQHQDGFHDEPSVHMAAGDMKFTGDWGERDFNQTQRYFNRPLSEVPESELARQSCDLIEFHCALARRDVFERVGILDEALLTTREHLDFCLRVLGADGTIYFEPASVITYRTPPPLRLSDLPYFSLRWSDQWTASTLRHFAKKWGIKSDYEQRMLKTRKRRQSLVFATLRHSLEPVLGRGRTDLLINGLTKVEPVINRAVVLMMSPPTDQYRTRVTHAARLPAAVR